MCDLPVAAHTAARVDLQDQSLSGGHLTGHKSPSVQTACLDIIEDITTQHGVLTAKEQNASATLAADRL